MTTGQGNPRGLRVFITGGAGFIGSQISRRLIKDNRVTVFDNSSRVADSRTLPLEHPNLSLIKGDVLDRDLLKSAMTNHQIVFHCAASLGVGAVRAAPVQTMRINVIGSVNVLDIASEMPSTQRIVCFSTSEVFGRQAVGAAESADAVIPAPGEARWSYAASKVAEEHYAMALYSEMGTPITIIRPFNIYGPGQLGEGAVANFVRAALENRALEVRAPGTQLRAWCFVEDFTNAVLQAAVSPAAIGQAFNVGNPGAVATSLELAQRVIEVTESRSPIELVLPIPDVEARTPQIDKARSLLGFHPSVPLDEGLVLTANWYRENLQ